MPEGQAGIQLVSDKKRTLSPHNHSMAGENLQKTEQNREQNSCPLTYHTVHTITTGTNIKLSTKMKFKNKTGFLR